MGRPKKTNRIIKDHGDWLVVDVSTSKHVDAVMKIDRVDFDKMVAAGYGRAYAFCTGGKVRVATIRNRRTTTVASLIVPEGGYAGHINSDCTDNRRSNLKAGFNGAQSNVIIADHGTWLELDISTGEHPAATMKIDRSDYDNLVVIGAGRFSPRFNGSKLYVVCANGGNPCYVHRLLVSGSESVDHINGDTTDNRRCNIRSCTVTENNRNMPVRKDNTSGFAGVRETSGGMSWNAHIEVDGKKMFLGVFDDKNMAVRARLLAEKEHFGKFMPLKNRIRLDSLLMANG